MDNCNSLSMPVCKGQNLSKSMSPQTKSDIEEMKNVPYAQVVGSLMYAMTSTRPDICHAAGLVSRFQSNPGKEHWQAVKRIFRYLKGTKNLKLCFGLCNLNIKGYTDVDFVGDSVHVFLFGGTAVS